MMQLLQNCFCRYSDEMNTIREGNIVLVDRDFCDVNFLTTNKKLHVYCLGLGQLDTIEANRFVFFTQHKMLGNRTSFWST